MSNLCFEVGRQVDDLDSTKRALLGADAAANAESFRDVCDLGLGRHLDAEFAGADDRA